MNLQLVLPNLIDMLKAAGSLILDVYDSHHGPQSEKNYEIKIDGSPLSKADIAAHNLIIGCLKKITPDIPIVSEEDDGSWRLRRNFSEYWLIDPLDGTKEFLNRSGEFTVNVALIKNNAADFGLVYAPVLDQLYWGGSTISPVRMEKGLISPIAVSQLSGKNKMQVLASKSHLDSDTEDFIARLGAIDLIQAGSSLKFCRIAEGLADIYPRMAPTAEWDTAAAQAILEAAGGRVVDTQGNTLKYSKEDIINPSFIATSLTLHQLKTYL